jgi:ribosomal protein S18 acetylase RimI-like enzyme
MALSGIRFDERGFAAHDFATLMGQIGQEDLDDLRLASALEATTNIGAWDGEELVGAVRVLTDGYLYATIPDIIVAPQYRRRGIGRELMYLALDNAPTGVVLFGSPPESSGFFERLGCQRAPSGYVLKRKVAPRVQSR